MNNNASFRIQTRDLVSDWACSKGVSFFNQLQQTILVESEHVPLNNKVKKKFSLMFVVLGPTCAKTYSNERKCK